MDDTTPELSPVSAHSRRVRVVSGAVAVALVVLVGVGIAAARSSDSHPAATEKGSADQGSTSSHGSTRARAAVTTSLPRRSSSPGSTNHESNGSGGSSSATTPRGSTPPPTRHGVSPTTVVVPVAIEQAYVQGFQDECRSLWAQAGPSGQLWDADSLEDPPHTVDECLDAVDPFYANAWSDYSVAEARDGGRSDADTAAEGMTVGNRFQTSSGLVVYIPEP